MVIMADFDGARFIPDTSRPTRVFPPPASEGNPVVSMPRCSVCETEVPANWALCGACGHPVDRAPTARSSPEPVRKALESARKALVASGPMEADLSFARALVERAEQTEAVGDLGKALDLARAGKRAMEISKRNARVAAELSRADEVLRRAREAGIETLAFERNVVQARALAGQGDLVGAEKLLRRMSIRTLDQRREKQLLQVIEKAADRVQRAKERGALVTAAQSTVDEAREALALREYGRIRHLAAGAIEAADAARRHARAEDLLNRVAGEVNAAREAGVNVTEARKVLTQGREALRKGLYADVQKSTHRGREILREARRHAFAEAALRETEREAVREKRRGADVARADAILEQASLALTARQYPRVRSLAQEAWDTVREAALLKHVQDALGGLRLDADDLRKLGADATGTEPVLLQLQEAIAAKDLPLARRLVGQARRAAESSRDAHYRGAMERTLSVILANAPRGLDPGLARQLLRQVDDALSIGQQVDVQALIDGRMTEVEEQTRIAFDKRIMKDRDLVMDLRGAGQSILAMEGKLADAAIAVAERRFQQADALLDAVEHDIYAMHELIRSEAAEALGEARQRLHDARDRGMAGASLARVLHDAEVAYSESRYSDVIYLSRSCVAEIDREIQTFAEKAKVAESEETRARTERVETITTRIESVRRDIEALVADNVDLGNALHALAAAQRAIETNALDEAERHVTSAEGIVAGVKTTLQSQATDALARARTRVNEARTEGILTSDIEALLIEADDALIEGRTAKVLELVGSMEERLQGRRKERLERDHRTAMDKARAAAGKFITVKRLIEDLRKADIDIAGAEDALKASERAIQEKAYDRVDEILADLDATAKELMDELVTAAKNLVIRATKTTNDARGLGIDTTDATALLAKAEAYFERADYDDAVEYARAAERKIQLALADREKEKADAERTARDSAQSELGTLKKIIADLGRADISIVTADAALTRAESAFADERYDDVARELEETKDIAESLTLGLADAATDLVQVAEREVQAARDGGLAPARAELVLANAKEAVRDRRFLEAIEYKKVIADILEDLRKQEDAKRIEITLSELRARADAHERLGANMHFASQLLSRAQERIDHGETNDLQGLVPEIGDAIDAGRRAHLRTLADSLGPLVEEGVALGMSRDELEEMSVHAGEAAAADDLDEVYRLKGDLRERILDSKRRAVLAKAIAEVQTLEDTLVQSERLGIPVAEARARLDAARQSIEAGDVPAFQRGVGDAKVALDQSRTKHFSSKYEARVHSISVMIADAKRLGAEVADAERNLADAETALRKNDLSMADILVKQAEVAVGIQIQNFIKNRYPNLILHLPAKGLQSNVWNRYAFEVENKGKLPARNVELAFGGDVETKGLEPISEIGVDERRSVEIGLKPSRDGAVPVQVGVSYQRTFDDNRYELKDEKELTVEPQGTYIVEDVFLIHSDGRLITHQSRKFREAIDEDIFSGMLTVVQDFIKDSFKRSRTALRRLEFGDSTILIERSPHTFLAAVLVGDEPTLLPLYMIEILKDVEGRFGVTLERWTGMLHQLEGIDGIVARLIDVASNLRADMGSLQDSPITMTARVIEALGVEQTEEVNALLQEAQSTLETDIALSWDFIERAKVQAETARAHLADRMAELLKATKDTVEEMKIIGTDTNQAELLLKEAEEAMREGKYERVREIQKGLHDSLERAKGELAAKKMEVELASLINDIQVAKSQNLDVREADSYLTKIENAIQRKSYRQMDEFLRRAKESLARQRRKTVIDKAREELSQLRATVAQAKEVQADLGDVDLLLDRAEQALSEENLKDLEPLLSRAEATTKARVSEVLHERYPRLFLKPAHAGLQANRWNRFEIEITNKGNWPAKDLTPTVLGPVEVEGLRRVETLEPNEKVSLAFGVKPRETGTMDFDFEVHYARPLDDGKYQVTDSAAVRVESEGGYVIEDALLIHENGVLVCHETRAFEPSGDGSFASRIEAEAEALVSKAFNPGAAQGVQRAAMGDESLLAVHGPRVYLVVRMRGEEPKALPLYLTQSLKEIDDAYGHRLEAWDGNAASLAGIGELVRKLLFVSETPGVSLGPLEDSPVSRIPGLVEKGLLRAPEGQDFLEWARNLVETSDYGAGVEIITQVVDATAAPTEEISVQIREAVRASKEAGALQLSDEQVAAYVDVLRRALEACFEAKKRAGIQRYWPISRVAIRTADQLGYDAITAFRKIIVSQSGAKELDIVPPNDTWRGMKVEVQVHMDSVSAAYKLWAKKIEILLQSQNAWKIRAGIERGEYSVGIEGQKVRIDPSMVTFVESVPEHVVEEPFAGGILYLDTRMTKDLLSEGYAKEVVNLVLDSRKDMKLTEERVVEVDIVATERLRSMIKPWKDMIMRETNALDVRFVAHAPSNAYVIESALGEDSFYLAIRAAEM